MGLFITAFGTSEYMFAFSALVAAMAILAIGRGHRTWHGGSLRLIAERAIYFFAAIAASGIVAQIVKHIVGRARPKLFAVDGPYSFHGLSIQNSWPASRRATPPRPSRPPWRSASCGRSGAAGCWLPPAIGLSRVLVGAHFPSDVVCGAVLGSPCLSSWREASPAAASPSRCAMGVP